MTPEVPRETVRPMVLAAGLGKRMRSTQPKVLHPVAGRPMIRHVLRTL
ncbi:MAG: NTP transferase domain-containing protein, partial [Armatimonadota bacterium]|nr:NTP transferase domain-containing protein [Armatimonadota bacterium]